jgi:hypothetical protein
VLDPRNLKKETIERMAIPDDPEVLEVPSKLKSKTLVLLSDWKM